MKRILSSFSLATGLVLQASLLYSPAPVHGVEKVKFSPHTFTLPDGYVLKRVAAQLGELIRMKH